MLAARATRAAVAALLLTLAPAVAFAADAFEEYVSKDPVAEATRAFKEGNKRHVVVPICQTQVSEVIPGWPMSGPTPPGMWEALEQGQRPFQCADLGDGLKSPKFLRLVKFAEQYNKRLLELEAKK